MDFLRKIGSVFARHYEKVLLVLALLGLVYAVYHLYTKKQEEEQNIQTYNRNIQKKQTQGIPATDLGPLTKALESAKNPSALNFGLPHNLFNAVKWQRRPDGTIIKIEKGTEVGPDALKLTKVTPLETTIAIERASGTGLQMSATQEASTNVYYRRKLSFFMTTNTMDRTKLFTLREIRGTPDKPEAVIELGNGDRAPVTADKPYKRVDGYKADLLYPPEGKTFSDRRIGDVLPLGGEDYIVVAINPNEIVVSARSNNRRTTIRNNAGP